MTLGNAFVEQTNFNNRLQPTSITATLGGTALISLGLGYGGATSNNGNLLSQTISPLGVTQNFTYDAFNRLWTASEGDWAQTFAYDALGNRAVVAGSYIPISAATPQVPSAGSPLPYSNNQWSGASYDAAGNITALNGTSFTYDAENRQTSSTQVINGTAYTTTYGYDGDGRRVTKSGTGTTTVYVYDAFGNLAAEYTSGSTTAAPCTTCYLTMDHLGSTRLVTDESGAVVSWHDYLPFGEEIPSGFGGRGTEYGATDNVKEKFTGKERDAETGLDFFGARYFSGAQGRFTSPDPKSAGADLQNPQSWNGYAYALNNPLAYVDPNGRWPFYVHNSIYAYTFSGIFSSSQMKLIQQTSWNADFGPGSQNPARSFTHSMCGTSQSLGACTAAINGFIGGRLSTANDLSGGGRDLNSDAIIAFAEALHALTDMGSPTHVADNGTPFAWGNGRLEGAAHTFAERGEEVNWFRIGQSVRLAIAGFLQAFPELAKKQGDPTAWANRVIDRYVSDYYSAYPAPYGNMRNTEGIYQSREMLESAARLCALSNPAACIQ